MVNSLVGAFRGNASFRPRAEPRDKQRTEGDDAKWYRELDESGDGSSPNMVIYDSLADKPSGTVVLAEW